MSIISPDNIRNHLANNSPSKVAHTFSKTKRFNSPNPEYHTPHSDARWPSMLLVRANSRDSRPPLGRGNVMTSPKI